MNPLYEITRFRGLYTHPNETSAPDGALSVANNCSIIREDTVEVRPGFGLYGGQVGISNSTTYSQMFSVGSNLYIWTDDGKIFYDNSGSWSGTTGLTASAPSGTSRIRFTEFNGNGYVTSSTGVQKFTGPTATRVSAGVPRALDIDLSLTGASGFLANNSQVAYRVIWGITDANNNTISGAPSSRFVVGNSSGSTSNVQVKAYIPSGITTANFFQIYRSTQTSTSVDPGDELLLAYEGNPSSTDISNGYVTITDISADSFLGDALYTNATQETIAQENDRPPWCTDMASYKGYLFFANCKQPQQLEINLVGTSGFTNGTSTITIAGVVYTADSSENTSTGHFKVSTGGTPAQNIESTAKSLIKCINLYSSNTSQYAYYVSTPTGVPGQIQIQDRSLGGSSWYVKADSTNTGSMFSPSLPTTNSSTAQSSDNYRANSLYYSKEQQPEHVPQANVFFVDQQSESIQRIVALRDSLVIIKDKSIWRLTGTSPDDFTITILDNTVSIVGRDTAAVLNNNVFMLSSQGIVAISDSGVQVVSRAIERDILGRVEWIQQSTNTTIYNLQSAIIGQGCESRREYYLTLPFVYFTPGESDSGSSTYVYNAFTQAFTQWFCSPTSMTILGDRIFMAIKQPTGYVNVVRQKKPYQDYSSNPFQTPMSAYSDDGGTITITAKDTVNGTISGTVSITLPKFGSYSGGSIASFDEGWVRIGTSASDPNITKRWVVSSLVSSSGGVDTYSIEGGVAADVGESGDWQIGHTYTFYRPVGFEVETLMKPAGAVATSKQKSSITITSECQDARKLNLIAKNESDYLLSPLDVEGEYSGSSTFSVSLPILYAINTSFEPSPTPTPLYRRYKAKTMIPANRQMGAEFSIWMKLMAAHAYFALKAVSVQTRDTQSDAVTQ